MDSEGKEQDDTHCATKDDPPNHNKAKRKGDTPNNKMTVRWKRKRLMYMQSINRQKQERRDAFDPKPIHSSLTDNWLDAAFEKRACRSFLHTQFPVPWLEKSFDMAHGLKSNHDPNKNCNDVHTRLWHVTDVPQRPSFLDFLLKCASVKLKQTEVYGGIDRGGHFEEVGLCAMEDPCLSSGKKGGSNHDFSSSGTPSEDGSSLSDDIRNSEDGRSNSSSISTDAADVSTTAKILKQLQNSNNKIHKSTQTVPKWVGNQQEIEMHQKECQQMHLALDETAAVAIGTLTDEIMVSSLLPLARRHVALCRGKTYNGPSSSSSSSSSTFVSIDKEKIGMKCISKMTLPAHEAIVDMILEECPTLNNHHDTCCIPSSQPPYVASSQISWHSFLPTVEELLEKSKESMMEMQQQRLKLEYLKKWRIRNKYSHDFLQDNHDLFCRFVGGNHDKLDHIQRKPVNVGDGCKNQKDDGKNKYKQSILDEIQDELESIVQGSSFSVASHTSESPIPMIFTSFQSGNFPKQDL